MAELEIKTNTNNMHLKGIVGKFSFLPELHIVQARIGTPLDYSETFIYKGHIPVNILKGKLEKHLRAIYRRFPQIEGKLEINKKLEDLINFYDGATIQ